MSALRLAVLLSGGGTTLQNFIDRIEQGRLDAHIVQVVSSTPTAYGLERACQANLPAATVSRKEAGSTEAFSERIFDLCRQSEAELVCMAGFLQLVRIPDDYHLKVMNIHPSLIPAFSGKNFYGHRVHEAVIAAGVRISGCTVHFADNEYDHGPIILQGAVPVDDDDTPDSLAAKVFQIECELYPEAVRRFAAGRLRVEGRRVRTVPVP